jgi:hypothetical protein
MKTIIARFTEISRAHEAIDALIKHNYDVADIGYVANDNPGEAPVREVRTVGATRGGVLGLLIGLGSFVIPSVGPLLAAGPLAVGLAGAAAADATHNEEDWLGRALIGMGVPGRDAWAYSEAVQRGEALVVMGSREVVADNITAILRSSGADVIAWYERDPKSSGA